MQYLKMLSLAAVAAMALMAFAGAGTASADELCTTAAVENMCPAGKSITTVEASLVGGSAKLTDTMLNTLVTCTGGGVKITSITGGTTKTVSGSIPKADLTWTGCTFTTDTVADGTADATQASGGGTTITATGSQVTINTGLFGSCVYGVGTGLDLGSVANGGTELVINKVVKKVSGAICPETTIWEATLKITNHNAVWFIKN